MARSPLITCKNDTTCTMKILYEQNFVISYLDIRYISLFVKKKEELLLMSIRFIRARRMKQNRYNPWQWKKKNDYTPLLCRDNKSVWRKKGTASTAKNVLRVRAISISKQVTKRRLYIPCMYIHMPTWILENPSYACVNKSTYVHAYLYPWFSLSFLCIRYAHIAGYCYAYKKFQFYSYAIARCCTIVCIA